MDKHNVFLISEDALKDFLRKFGKGPDSKDYEYSIALYMMENLQRANGGTYSIVFDLKDGKTDVRRTFKPTPEETNEILRGLISQDTPVDFGLVRGTIDKHDPYAFAFQVKRFIGNSVENFTKELLNYLEKITKKYRPGEVSLIVIAELSDDLEELKANIDINFLKRNIRVPQSSFIAIFILTYDEKPKLFQIWP